MKNNEYRDENERRIESLQIIYQLRENNISSKYSAIKLLLEKLTDYVKYGERIELNIPFPELNKRIKGVLAVKKNEKCVVVLKHIN